VGANADRKAYIFPPNEDGSWDHTSHLNAIQLEPPLYTSDFGIAVAICDKFAVVSSNLARKVFVYARDTSHARTGTHGWDVSVYATIDAYTDYQAFGSSIAIAPSGDDLVVGADGNNTAFIFQVLTNHHRSSSHHQYQIISGTGTFQKVGKNESPQSTEVDDDY
jgi:hypothetical protein